MSGSKNNWQDAGRNGRSYLLRCWQEGQPSGGDPGALIWRFALVPIDDQSNPKGFACLEDLFGYLRGQLLQEERLTIE